MRWMFYNAKAFEQTLCGVWLSSAANKAQMFAGSLGKIGTATMCRRAFSVPVSVHPCLPHRARALVVVAYRKVADSRSHSACALPSAPLNPHKQRHACAHPRAGIHTHKYFYMYIHCFVLTLRTRGDMNEYMFPRARRHTSPVTSTLPRSPRSHLTPWEYTA